MNSCIKLSASAGSGKTFRLTLEFLKIVLQKPDDFRKVLAVTFTNKAALEMKDRFVEALYELSQKHEASKYYTHVAEEYNPIYARKALHSILHRYDEFSISTMDHFFLKLLRLFSSEIFVNPNFDVEQEKLLLDDYIMNRLFTDMMENDPIVHAIIYFLVDRYLQDELNPLRLKKAYLPDYLNLYMTEEFHDLSAETFDIDPQKLDEILNNLKDDFVDSTINLGLFLGELNLLFSNNPSAFHEKLGRVDSIYKEFVNKILPEFDSKGWYDVDEIFKKENKAGQVYSMSFVRDEGLKAEVQRCIFEFYRAFFEQKWYAEIIRGIPKVLLVSYLNRLREEFKRDNGILFLFEFGQLIAQLLKKYSVPFIYEYLGNRLEHLFIDEFQDTSYLQYKNFFPLVEELLSRGERVMVVGDIKQSIYRWRNGNFEIMRNFPHLQDNILIKKALNETDFEEEHAGLSHQLNTTPVEETLDKNFRSAKNIVEFNNCLYAHLSKRYHQWNDDRFSYENLIDVEEVFRDVVQQPQAKIEDDGWIHLIFYESEKNKRSKNEIDSEEPGREEESRWLVLTEQEIRQILDKYGCMPGDIAVLLRTNQEIYTLSQYLTAKGIRVESPGLFKLSASPHVRLAMACWGYLAHPDDSLIRAEILVNFKKVFQTSNGFDQFFNSLQQIEQSSLLVPVDILEKILGITVNSANIAIEGGDFVTFLREEIYKLQLRGVCSVRSIWRWWQEEGREVLIPSTPSKSNVQVMTVHSSKGLEFPFVILPRFPLSDRTTPLQTWLKWKVGDREFVSHNRIFKPSLMCDDYPVWMKNLQYIHLREERMRDIDWLALTYVATTRAKYGMSIFVEKKSKYESIFAGKALDLKKLSGIDALFVYTLHDYLQDCIASNHAHRMNGDEYVIGSMNMGLSFESHASASVGESPYTCDFNQGLTLFIKKSESSKVFQSIQFGEWIHKILQNIYSADDVEKVINAFVMEGLIGYDMGEKLQKKLQGLDLLFPDSSRALILNERSITSGKKIYRPDRIIIDRDNALILDYKTGEPEEEHKNQIKMYSDLLKKFFNTVNHKLIYINSLNL